ncbi:putative reverse transcriptase domain-containing protein [Tanacetum coccineum]
MTLIPLQIPLRVGYLRGQKSLPPRIFKKKSVKRIVEKRWPKLLKNMERQETDSKHLLCGSGISKYWRDVAQRCMDVQKDGSRSCSDMVERKCSTLGLANAIRSPGSNVINNSYDDLLNTAQQLEIQRMEQELWTLTLKGDDIEAYNNRFHEMVLMCPELVSTEKKKIEKYISWIFPMGIKEMLLLQSLRLCMMQSTWL